ncbi:hypothetical protein WR25_09791 isoform A [Diploscapter pachys]|nr:hypothetical protein WR25_09791 isoform A [Diploscapter pachys]
MERKLRFLESQIVKDNIIIGGKVDDGDYKVMGQAELNQLEGTLTDLEKDVKNMIESDAQLKRNFLDLKEWDAVLDKTDEFFQGGIDDQATEELNMQDEEGLVRADKAPVGYLVGVIRTERLSAFERVLWRACHHTAYLRSSHIDEELVEENGDSVKKSVFIVFHRGDRMRGIIEKVCDGFKARLFKNCPTTFKERQSARSDVCARIHDVQIVINQTKEHRFRVLQAAANNLNQWLKQARMQKTVYSHLNLFSYDGAGKFFVAECWIPLKHIESVREALERGSERSGSAIKPVLNVLETHAVPPTYNQTNKFTAVFQGIVDSYGVASYRELNPAPYTIISFPFIFACMFGDLGHGLLMFLSGLWFVVREKNLMARNIKDEIFGMFFGGRYIILMMGLFSVHAGILYNDIFAKSFNIFGSSWRNPYNHTVLDNWIREENSAKKSNNWELDPAKAYMHDMGPYPFGMDPIWNLAENKLNFLNSMKMKLSVILGITQMTFGVILSFFNHSYFKSKIDILTVFIPQMIFMTCIFIYLCLEIILKWIFFWVKPEYVFGRFYPGSNCAPSLLIGLINMFMFKQSDNSFVLEGGAPGNYTVVDQCYLSQWYPGQKIIENILVVIAVLCVPVMLFGKPLHFYLEQKKKRQAVGDQMSVRATNVHGEGEVVINGHANGKKEEAHGEGGGHGHEDESFGDIFVHSAIHTIEYVLGCVSHTASYLRLWALSLAHAQLSEVLWHMVFITGTGISEVRPVAVIATYIIFFFFGVLTFAILVLMEGLSAFLHALRLHWVEFQSKFYLGLGYPFVPFSFKSALQGVEIGSS